MSGSDVFVVVIGSAVVSAIVSSVTIAYTQWRERIARRENMLLTAAVDLSKSYVGRIAALPGNALAMEISVIPMFQKMLKEVIATDGLSKQHREALLNYTDPKKMLAIAEAREAKEAKAAQGSTGGGAHG